MDLLAFDSGNSRHDNEQVSACWCHDRCIVALPPDTRKQVVCGQCGLNSRIRSALERLLSHLELTPARRGYATLAMPILVAQKYP